MANCILQMVYTHSTVNKVKGTLRDSQFLDLKDIARTLVSRRVWPEQIAYC